MNRFLTVVAIFLFFLPQARSQELNQLSHTLEIYREIGAEFTGLAFDAFVCASEQGDEHFQRLSEELSNATSGEHLRARLHTIQVKNPKLEKTESEISREYNVHVTNVFNSFLEQSILRSLPEDSGVIDCYRKRAGYR